MKKKNEPVTTQSIPKPIEDLSDDEMMDLVMALACQAYGMTEKELIDYLKKKEKNLN